MEKQLELRLRTVLQDEDVYNEVARILEEEEAHRREIQRKRQSAGIRKAKQNGIKFGRPRIDNLEEFEVVLHAWESGEITKAAAAERLGISLRTYHKRVVEFRNRREQSPADRVRHIEKEIEEKRR